MSGASHPSGVELDVISLRDAITGTVKLEVTDPNGQVADVGFEIAVTHPDGSQTRSGPYPADQYTATQSPGVGEYVKNVTLDPADPTTVQGVVTLRDTGERLLAAPVEFGPRAATTGGGTGVVEVQDADTAATQATRFVFQGGVVNVDGATKVATFDLDGRYLPRSGGTVVGDLIIQGRTYAHHFNLGGLTDLVDDAPWYGLGMSNVPDNAGRRVQVAGYYGLTLRSATNALILPNIGSAAMSSSLNVGGNLVASGAVYASNWLRSLGPTGWFNDTYGGGIYMNDPNWVRVFNNKGFAVDNTLHVGGGGGILVYAERGLRGGNSGGNLHVGVSGGGHLYLNWDEKGSGADVVIGNGVGAEIARFASNGKLSVSGSQTLGGPLGIGTPSPQARLDVQGTAQVGVRYLRTDTRDARITVGDPTKAWSMAVGWAAGGDFSLVEEGAAGNRIYVQKTTGYVGLNTSSPAFQLHVNGTTRLGGDVSNDYGHRIPAVIYQNRDPQATDQAREGTLWLRYA